LDACDMGHVNKHGNTVCDVARMAPKGTPDMLNLLMAVNVLFQDTLHTTHRSALNQHLRISPLVDIVLALLGRTGTLHAS
jgi:hypothetical protein